MAAQTNQEPRTSQYNRSAGTRGSLCNLRVGSLNCRGLCDKVKRTTLFDFFRDSRLTIIFIQETKLNPFLHSEYEKEWHNSNIFLNSVTGGRSGTGILFNTSSVKILNRLSDHEGRVLVLDIDIFGNKFHLVNTYFPGEPFEKRDFIYSLYPYLSSNYPVIWMGDHNIVTEPMKDRLPRTTENDYCYQYVVELIDYFSFSDVCRVLYPSKDWYTFKGPSSRSRIDKVLISPSLEALAYDQLELCVTDHDLLTVRIQYRSLFSSGRNRWRNNCRVYEDQNFLQDFKRFFTFESFKVGRVHNPNKWWVDTKYGFKLESIKKGKDFSVEEKRRIQMMECGLQNLGEAILRDPQNKALYNEYERTKKDLAKQQLEKAKERIFKGKADAIMFGVLPTKTFFDKYKHKVNKGFIKCLKGSDGEPHFDGGGIVNIVEQHFERLFQNDNDFDDDTVQLFLGVVQEVDGLWEIDLTCEVSLQELKDVLSMLPFGSGPGPDGISYEFYKKIGSDEYCLKGLLRVLNKMLLKAKTDGVLPAKMVEGIITLVPKREPFDEIENYRPITLLNTDLKILTKIIANRLNSFLSGALHPSQYAQPGKDINLLNAQIRDIQADMENGVEDSFFVSVDFKTAFDKVSHDFLFKVLEKKGFATPFINFVKALYQNASSVVYVNGHKTKKIKLKSGIRQGCTFSRPLFTFSLDPLLCFLNTNSMIRKFRCKTNKEVLTSCFTDDLNLTMPTLSSLLMCLFYIERYKQASGLEIIFSKAKGIFYNKRNFLRSESLPNIKWVTRVKILGINYGPAEFVNAQWVEKLNEIRDEVRFYQTVGVKTLQGKAILSRSKLLPKVSYMANIHPIPPAFVKQIDDIMLKFIVGHDKSMMDLYNFAACKRLGGYCIDFVSLHASLFLLRPVLMYIKSKSECGEIPEYLHYVEYYIGWQLCSYYKLVKCNTLPHALEPNDVYKRCFALLRDFKITIDECLNAKNFSVIYHRIVNEYCETKFRGIGKFYRLHSKVLPEYLRTFNYRLHFSLLPLNTKFVSYALDTDSRCYFCGWGPENEWHLFGKCDKLKLLWNILDEVVKVGLEIDFSFVRKRTQFGEFDLVYNFCPGGAENVLVYLNTVVNHKIYKLRNEIKHNGERFDIEGLYNKIVRSVAARKNIESRMTQTVQIDRINELYRAMILVKDLFFDRREQVR